MSLELKEIGAFDQTASISGAGEEYIVVRKADGKTYKMSTADFKAFLGTVQTIAPRAISPTDPAPTLPGIYRPTVSGTYANLGGLVIDMTGKLNEVLYDGTMFVNVVTELPEAENKVEGWTAKPYKAGQQSIRNNQLWEAVIDTTAAQEPGLVAETIWKRMLGDPSSAYSVGSTSSVTVRTVEKQVVLSSAYINYGGRNYIISKTLDYSGISDSSTIIIFNPMTSTVEVVGLTALQNMKVGILGVIRTGGYIYINGIHRIDNGIPRPFMGAKSDIIIGGVLPNIVSSSRKLVFASTFIICDGGLTIINKELDFSSYFGNTSVYVYYSAVTKDVSLSTTVKSNDDEFHLIGFLNKDSHQRSRMINGLTVDGVMVGPASPVEDSTHSAYSMGSQSSLNIDTLNQKVYASGAYIKAFGKNKLINSATIDYSSVTSSTKIIVLNKSTEALEVVGLTTAQDTKDKAVLGVIRGRVALVNGVHSVDGGVVEPFKKTYLDNVINDLPFMFSGGYKSSLPEFPMPVKQDLNTLYSHYDDLVTNFPSEWSKSTDRTDAFGNPLYRYDFNPVQPRTAFPDMAIKNRVIVTTCVHGYERSAALGVALFFKDLMYNESNQQILDDVRANLKFTIIPIVTPTGFLDSTRRNRNGVDIARNFEYGHKVTDPSGDDYGGLTPLSEIESQYVNDVINSCTDAFVGIDRHNDGSYEGAGFCTWTGSHLPQTQKFLYSFAKWSNMFCQRDYGIVDTSGTGVSRLLNSPDADLESQYFIKGLQSIILETDAPSSLTELERQHFETEMFGNLILAICRKYLAYN